jgi:hypothetical protein
VGGDNCTEAEADVLVVLRVHSFFFFYIIFAFSAYFSFSTTPGTLEQIDTHHDRTASFVRELRDVKPTKEKKKKRGH